MLKKPLIFKALKVYQIIINSFLNQSRKYFHIISQIFHRNDHISLALKVFSSKIIHEIVMYSLGRLRL